MSINRVPSVALKHAVYGRYALGCICFGFPCCVWPRAHLVVFMSRMSLSACDMLPV